VRRDPILDKRYIDHFLAAAHAKLSDAQLTFAWAMGLNMSLEEAIAYALKELDG
jgi:hypothetical protein